MYPDPENSTLLDGLSEEARRNFPLLLERIDGRFMHQISLLRAQISGRMERQEAGSKNREGRLQKLENCPCAVHRDPGHTCVVLDTKDALARIEAKVDAKISPLKLKLAYLLGALWLLAFLLDLTARALPFLLGR
ncbi:MAG: hypothetical protein FJ121_08920 [Deltaproteobacteria bacterium]|nr:hypothetical protein [Deltaproteobacteria bacterium]